MNTNGLARGRKIGWPRKQVILTMNQQQQTIAQYKLAAQIRFHLDDDATVATAGEGKPTHQ